MRCLFKGLDTATAQTGSICEQIKGTDHAFPTAQVVFLKIE